MRNFGFGTNFKHKFCTWKGKYILHRLSKYDKYDEYFFEVIPEVFYTSRFFKNDRNHPDEVIPMNEELYNELFNKFFCPLREIDKEEMINIALRIINEKPQLREQTLMGWTPYEDKTKDPNYFGGVYIFPDGNNYTVTLHKGLLSVFPGDTNACFPPGLPFAERRINIQQWSDKIYKNNNTVIEFEEK